jgi:hypothetical protein
VGLVWDLRQPPQAVLAARYQAPEPEAGAEDELAPVERAG